MNQIIKLFDVWMHKAMGKTRMYTCQFVVIIGCIYETRTTNKSSSAFAWLISQVSSDTGIQ